MVLVCTWRVDLKGDMPATPIRNTAVLVVVVDVTIIYVRFLDLLGGGGGVPGVVGASTNSTSVVTKTCTIDQLLT